MLNTMNGVVYFVFASTNNKWMVMVIMLNFVNYVAYAYWIAFVTPLSSCISLIEVSIN